MTKLPHSRFLKEFGDILEDVVVKMTRGTGVVCMCAQGAHRAPTGAVLMLMAGGVRFVDALEHVYRVRQVVDLHTNDGRHKVMQSVLPNYEGACRRVGRSFQVTVTLPQVMEYHDFVQVCRTRFYVSSV